MLSAVARKLLSSRYFDHMAPEIMTQADDWCHHLVDITYAYILNLISLIRRENLELTSMWMCLTSG
jgi:hypothetical protein